ncbi:MAG: hypothetical protein HRU38_16155 [Saccharospirillaceae bacterium]|nr:hypothetical protein [Pseudomonadales bacterium]NRB80176.1 hypothetical protein [Saccharospirillaceae bacterium]
MRHPVLNTVIACLVILVITYGKFTGFINILVIFILIPSTLKSLYFILIKQKERKQRLIKLCLWTVTILATCLHHLYLSKTSEQLANDVLSKINSYNSTTNNYPESLDIININPESTKEYYLIYSFNENSPFLYYRSTWMIYNGYQYDFDNKKWIYITD